MKPLAVGVVALTALASTSVIAATAASADTHTPSATAESAGHGHALWLDALGLDVVGTGSGLSEFPDNVGPNGEDLDLSVLSALTVDIGTGVNIPLIGDGTNGGLLDLGGLGAISSFSESVDAQHSAASAGLIGEDGGISLNPESAPADFDRATLDASGLLRQVLPDVLVDTVLDEASVSVGALASRAESVDGQPASEYLLSGVGLDVHSPVVGDLTTTVDSALGTLLAPLNALVGPGGAIQNTLGTLIASLNGIEVPLVAQVNASLNSLSLDTTPLTDEIRSSLLAEPLENAEGSLSVDLSTGVIHVDLDDLLTDGGGAVGLSSLEPNTNLLSGEAVTSIVDGVSELLLGNGPNSLVTKVVNLLNEGIYNVAFDISLQIEITNPLTGLSLVNAPVTLATNLGGLTGQPGYTPAVFDVSGITVAGIPVGTIVQPIANLLAGTVSTIGGTVLPVVQTLLTNAQPALTAAVGAVLAPLLDDALGPVLSNLLEVTVNEQPAEGDLGPGSFTVRALSIELLPILGAGSANLQLGSSTVISAEAEATLSATPNPVEQGGTVTLSGSGFVGGEDVTVTLPDGTTTTVTAEADGTFSTTWDVPADFATGDAEFSATGDTSGRTATATTEVEAAADTDVNANASASASASADAAADDDATASAQAAAQAAANDDNTSDASAAADVSANAAAEVAATADASSEASAETNAAASAAATASADSTADSASNADASAAASAAANADASAAADAASEAAAEATSSADASSAASADATADADADAGANPTDVLQISDPADRTVTEGEDAAFIVEVVQGTPTSVTWEEFTPVVDSDAAGGPVGLAAGAWSPAVGTLSDNGLMLTVPAAALTLDGTLYRAVATDGTATDISAAAELTVNPAAAVDADSDSGGTADASGAAANATANASANASGGTSSSASANASGNASGGAKHLVNTGGESLVGLGAAGIVLLLAGAGLTLAMRRRHALRRD